ncbi:putative MazG nucleotide pyrophosphohydrolase domain protein [uncultured Thiomicrorhabdus sp.]
MKNSEFIKQSERTDRQFPEGVKLNALEVYGLFNATTQLMQVAGGMDSLKKSFVYGVDAVEQSNGQLSREDFEEQLQNANEALEKELSSDNEESQYAHNIQNLDQKSAEMLHHAIGLVTEASELFDSVFSSVARGEEFDEANILEEQEDVNWYIAGINRIMNTTPEQANKACIEKLKHRYPDKFSKEKAAVRDLEGERKILEENVS